jgi:hypothetical protein
MRKMALCAVLSGWAVASLSAGTASVKGTYVEARTSQIFAGACVVNSEAGTTGREALLAWKVDGGSWNGVPLGGLAVVAAVSGDANLSVHEIGGEVANTRAALFVDARGTVTQRAALLAMAKTLSNGLVGTVVEATPASIEFIDGAQEIRVATSALRLVVQKQMEHDVQCGNKQWFRPFSTVDQAAMGVAAENVFDGAALGTKWSDPNKRSAYFGTFSY